MGVSKNASTEEVIKSRKLYTGIGEFKVFAINPTMDELHEHEVMVQSEPKYEVDFGEGPLTKVVAWCEFDGAKIPLEILLTPGPWLSKTGKYKWYNRTGQETWGFEIEKGSGILDFDRLHEKVKEFYKEPETAYRIPKGGDTLTDFVKAWANVETDGEIFLSTINKIADSGDVKELRELLGDLKENQVRLLAFVRDGKYNALYTRHFGRMKPKRDDWFISAMSEEYGEVKGEYTMKWQEYDPTEPQADAVPEGGVSSDEDYDIDAVDGDPLEIDI